jgi:hypothetical protein
MKEDKYKISIKKKLFGDSYLVDIKNKTEQDSAIIPAFFHSTHLFGELENFFRETDD